MQTTQNYNPVVHPKKCPHCRRVWEMRSAEDCRCMYCKWRLRFDDNLHEGETKLLKMFIPIVAWVLLGLAILWFIGRKFNG